MSSLNYSRGSEWRRWDLHIHTPKSYLNNQFGSDFDEYVKQLFRKAIENNICVIGITDYFTIEGYTKIRRDYLENSSKLSELFSNDEIDKIKRIRLFPNIEFRLSTIVHRTKGQNKDGFDFVNYHVLFSDEVSIEDIKDNFLSSIDFKSIGYSETPLGTLSLTIGSIENTGKRLKLEHKAFSNESDIIVGMKNISVDLNDMLKVINERLSIFKDKYLLILAVDEQMSQLEWDSRFHLIKKVHYQSCSALFSSQKSTESFARGEKSESLESFINEFHMRRPCLHGSDAHSFDELFNPDRAKYNWIKADPTFEGLKQAILEPTDRVFIGQEPPALSTYRRNGLRIIDSIQIKKFSDKQSTDNWFDCEIGLNPGLVTIIGNKGSGKSALADVLALAGDTIHMDKMSFLNGRRFLSSTTRFGEKYYCLMRWLDKSETETIALDTKKDYLRVEKVKYLPQDFIETVCNSINKPFEKELGDVIFQYIPEDEKQGCNNIDELIDRDNSSIRARIEVLKMSLSEANKRLLELQSTASQRNLAFITSRIDEISKSIKALESMKPEEVPNPDTDESEKEENAKKSLVIDELQTDLIALAKEREEKLNELTKLTIRNQAVINLRSELASLQYRNEQEIGNIRVLCHNIGIVIDSVVKFEICYDSIDELQNQTIKEKNSVSEYIKGDIEKSLDVKISRLESQIQKQKEELSSAQQKYFKYKQELQSWESNISNMIGDDNKHGSLKYFERQLKYVTNEIQNEIQNASDQRDQIAEEILELIFNIKDNKAKYFEYATKAIIQDDIISQSNLRVSFDTSFDASTIKEHLIKMIDLRRIGPFQGEEGANQVIQKIIQTIDTGDSNQIMNIPNSIIQDMFEKNSPEGKQSNSIQQQLASGCTDLEFMNYLYGFSYLEPKFNISYDNKDLSILSPGEKGILLIIFYLLLDRDNSPIVIDQPEENIDNKTVSNVLVKCIKAARKKRQVIIVTHNPNIAVYCDADQVIVASLNSDNGYRISYESGSIENPIIKRHIIDILEGTKPAFINRERKYKSELGTN